MNHGNGNQGTQRLEQKCGPFNRGDRQLTQDDALTPRIERLGFGAPRVAIER